MHLMHPKLIFTMGQVRQRNGVKPPETRVLDVKYMVRNQTDVVGHRNGVKIPKILVLVLKEWIKIFFIKLTNSFKHSLILAKIGIEVHLMHEFLHPELFLVF